MEKSVKSHHVTRIERMGLTSSWAYERAKRLFSRTGRPVLESRERMVRTQHEILQRDKQRNPVIIEVAVQPGSDEQGEGGGSTRIVSTVSIIGNRITTW